MLNEMANILMLLRRSAQRLRRTFDLLAFDVFCCCNYIRRVFLSAAQPYDTFAGRILGERAVYISTV